MSTTTDELLPDAVFASLGDERPRRHEQIGALGRPVSSDLPDECYASLAPAVQSTSPDLPPDSAYKSL